MRRIWTGNNIVEALDKVVVNRGASSVNGMTIFELRKQLPDIIDRPKERIRAGKHKPSFVRRVEIPNLDGGTRTPGVSTAVDRMIQQTVAQVLVPVYELTFSDSSFGFRPGRSAHDTAMYAKNCTEEGYT